MKYILIFNGYPKSGKTTIQNEILNKYPNSYIYSSIKPVIEFLDNIINDYGSDDLKSRYFKEKSGKTNKYRNLLSDIKLSFYDFDNGVFWNTEILKHVLSFMDNKSSKFFMIDIREPRHISSFINYMKAIRGYNKEFRVFSIFVNREHNNLYLNESDANVEKYKYDFYVNNKKDLTTLKEKVVPELIKNIECAYLEDLLYEI